MSPGAAVCASAPFNCVTTDTISGFRFGNCTAVDAPEPPGMAMLSAATARVTRAAWLCTRTVSGCGEAMPAAAYRPSALARTGPASVAVRGAFRTVTVAAWLTPNSSSYDQGVPPSARVTRPYTTPVRPEPTCAGSGKRGPLAIETTSGCLPLAQPLCAFQRSSYRPGGWWGM